MSGAAPVASGLPDRAERRQLTLVFCDLVDSVVLSTRLDPEDLRDLISAYQRACAKSVQLYGGYVARYVGDGVLIYFGYPTAHEDNAERAICAALDVVAAVSQLPDNLTLSTELRIRVRIGIATGVVVVGDGIEDVLDRGAVVGEAANLAARLQAIAEPNTIVVSEITRQLAGERFAYRNLGTLELKGFADPVPAYRVLERREVTRLQARGGALTPFIGREEEIRLLLERWERAAAGRGQVVALVGQAGVGKSRTTAEFIRRIGEHTPSAAAPIVLQYSPYHANAPLYPVVGYIGRLAGIGADDSPAEKLAKLGIVLGGDDMERREDLRLVADFMGMDQHEALRLPAGPVAKRDLTIKALANHFADCATRGPVVIVFEDTQWIDPTSKLLLARLADWARTSSAFIVITSRPASRDGVEAVLQDSGIAPTAGIPPDHVMICDIRELSPGHGRMLAGAIPDGSGQLDPGQLDAILAKSAGIPLYIEELVKAAAKGFAISDARGKADQGAVPHTISDALMAQLDPLGDAKNIAQQAAVIGQEFPLALLQEVTRRPLDELMPLLDRLINAGIVTDRVSLSDAYRFKHALIRDIAYRSLLRKNRRQLHCAVARALSHQFPAGAGSDLIAQHYSVGAAHAEAIEFWRRGAAEAIARSANDEAVAMLASALAELQHLGTARRPELELELVLAQAAALRSVRGYSAAEVEKRLARARELCAICGDVETKFSVEWSLFLCTMVKGDIDGARAFADSLLELAGNEPGPSLVDALIANGMVAFHIGDFEAASRFHQAGAAMSRPEIDQPRFLTHGQNAGLFCLSYLARSQCMLGQLDRGRATINQARTITAERADDPGHIHTCINVAMHAVRVYHQCDDLATEKRFAEEVVEIARRNHYAYYQALGMCHLGWVAGAEGEFERGIAMLKEGMARLSGTGTALSLPGFHLLLAELYLRADKPEEAMRSLALAVGSDGFALWDADIERVRGDILARQTPTDWDAVETAYRSSLEIARRQQARLLICKAGLSLARLLEARAERKQGYELLRDCIMPLKEGYDVGVVQQARRMIQELVAPL